MSIQFSLGCYAHWAAKSPNSMQAIFCYRWGSWPQPLTLVGSHTENPWAPAHLGKPWATARSNQANGKCPFKKYSQSSSKFKTGTWYLIYITFSVPYLLLGTLKLWCSLQTFVMAQVTRARGERVFLSHHYCGERQADNHEKGRLPDGKEETEGVSSLSLLLKGQRVHDKCHYLSLATSHPFVWMLLKWVGARNPVSITLGFWEAA